MIKTFNKFLWGSLLMTVLLSQTAFAQSTPKYSNEFLSIGVGARALGMSNAMTSVADDVTAAYWNPAALTDIEHRYQFSFQHAAYFQGVANYDYLGAAIAIDTDSHLGIALIRLGIDDIPDTRLLFDDQGRIDYSLIDFFSTSDVALVLSYARGVSFIGGETFAEGGGLTFGVNFKVVRRSIGAFAKAWGFGLDASMKYRVDDWNFGVMVRDISTTFNSWTIDRERLRNSFNQTNNEIPGNSLELTLPKMIVGASRSFVINSKIDMLASTDLTFSFDGRRNVLIPNRIASIDPSFGFEFDYEDKFFLRMGMGNFQRVKDFTTGNDLTESTFWTFQPNMGMGIQLDEFTIDYALTDIGNVAESPYSHVFSITYSLEPLAAIYSKNKRRIRKKNIDNDK
ncbi:PorV/PorQ family protein [Roseivirga sp.]|uniref:putative type IX sorting system protein PorV2 n=1 Tax=Roseivirga sp. TaxID=1964215 RepID=UPI003BACDCFB